MKRRDSFSADEPSEREINARRSHHCPIDYFFGGVTAAADLTFTPGTAVGWFQLPGSNGGPGYGIGLSNGLAATFNGTVTAPCVFAFYDTVQEGNGLWPDRGWLAGLQNGGTYDAANPAHLVANFTGVFALAGDPSNYRDGTGGQHLQRQISVQRFQLAMTRLALEPGEIRAETSRICKPHRG